MTPPLDLGLRFIVEPSAAELSSVERELLRELRPAGIMLRRRNFLQDRPYEEWLDALRTLLAGITDSINRPNYIISIDHEGGRVHRYPPPITRFPYPAFYAASLEAIESVAAAMAIELRSVGINVSFSPVADIHSNPSNPVINQRAFGKTADEVCERSLVFARALRSGGVMPCIKHFPGHGDTGVDSHYTLPVLDRTLEELTARELTPFAAHIREGIEMVMSAHIVLPRIDPDNQATVSPAVMTGILRNSLGFQGVSIADALGMGAIREDVRDQAFPTRATEAGTDLLLMVGDPVSIEDALRARDALGEAVLRGEVDNDKVTRAQRRIEKLLSSLPMYPVRSLSGAVLQAHADLAARLSTHHEWEEFEFVREGFE